MKPIPVKGMPVRVLTKDGIAGRIVGVEPIFDEHNKMVGNLPIVEWPRKLRINGTAPDRNIPWEELHRG